MKRRLRDAVRRVLWPVLRTGDAQGTPTELVVWATPSSYAATFEALLGDVARIATRLPSGPPSGTPSEARVVEDAP